MAGGEKKSDLGVRTVSAVVMVAVAGTGLWLGGWVWAVFIAAVALGVLWEWRGLVVGFEPSPMKRGLWNAGGLVYVGIAAITLALARSDGTSLFATGSGKGLSTTVLLVALVIFVDVGAYFFGRTFGGPKIAPKISPSKTWSGLLGGVVGATLAFYLLGTECQTSHGPNPTWAECHLQSVPWEGAGILLFAGIVVAIIAQAGDFFESWMKRRAGVKDSGTLIPGHGGLFDRVDGLLAVCFVLGVVFMAFYGHDLIRLGTFK
ncbi:MAG: phosphatidate cytidylyltransferase [Novosphingobium sp.]